MEEADQATLAQEMLLFKQIKMEDLRRVKDIMVIFKDKNLNKVALKNTKNIIQEKTYNGLVGTGSVSVSVYKLQKVKKKIKIRHKYLSK